MIETKKLSRIYSQGKFDVKAVDEISSTFKKGEFNQDKPYPTNPSKKNCKYCEFNQTEHCSDGVK